MLEYSTGKPNRSRGAIKRLAIYLAAIFGIGVVLIFGMWLFATFVVLPASLQDILQDNFAVTLPAGAVQSNRQVIPGDYGAVFYKVSLPHGSAPSFITTVKASAAKRGVKISIGQTNGYTYKAPSWWESNVPPGSEEIDSQGSAGLAEMSWTASSDDIYVHWSPW